MVRKLDLGGAVQSLFDKPALYQGIQFTPTRPELPDLEAIGYLQQRKAANEARLDAERAKLHPDKEAMAKLQEKTKGLNGQVSDLYGQYMQKVRDYEKEAVKPGNNIFSPEMRARLNEVNNFITHDELNRLQNNQANIDAQYKNAEAKGLSSSVWVNDKGQLALRDAEGNIRTKDAGEYYAESEKNPKLAQQYQVLTTDDLKQHYYNNVGFGHKDFLTLDGQNSMEDASKEIEGYFNNLGSKEGERVREQLNEKGIQLDGTDVPVMQQISGKYGNNADARAAAYSIAYNSLSAKSRSAIMSDMISKGYDPSKINAFLKNRLGNESEKRAKVTDSRSQTSSFLPKHLTDEKDAKAALADSTMMVANKNLDLLAETRGFDWSHHSGVYVAGVATGQYAPKPNETLPTVAFKGRTFRLGDTDSKNPFTLFGAAKSDLSYNGNSVRVDDLVYDKDDPKETTIHYLMNATAPIATGVVRDASGNVITSEVQKDAIITRGKVSSANITDPNKPMLSDKYGTYFEDDDRNRVYFNNQGAKYYRQGKDTFVELMNREESIKMLGKNTTSERAQSDYYGEKGQPVGATEGMISILRDKLRDPRLELPENAAYKQYLNQLVDMDRNIRTESQKLRRNDGQIQQWRQTMNDALEEMAAERDRLKWNSQQIRYKPVATANPDQMERQSLMP